LPYKEYFFLLQDNAYGGLEHSNSVTLGAPTSQLKENFTEVLYDLAHEYFHTWNIMRIRPAEYGEISYKKPPLSRGLWWSEGLTMFYADLLLRRANLPVPEPTRIKHLERLVQSYFQSAGNYRISPEEVSRAEYGPTGLLGDYTASTHLQGELLGTMLDLIIRDQTNGLQSMDTVMRLMLKRFGGAKGFTGKDIEQIVEEVCKCNLESFFQKYVQGKQPLNLNTYLQLIGLRMDTSWRAAIDNDGKLIPDFRIFPWQDKEVVKIMITDPFSVWGKAGLHTGNEVISINGQPIKHAREFQQIIRNIHIGDSIVMKMKNAKGKFETKVIVTGYQQPIVKIQEIQNATERQQRLRSLWIAGK
jgi:predicted metalloprotease with PDZ domain